MRSPCTAHPSLGPLAAHAEETSVCVPLTHFLETALQIQQYLLRLMGQDKTA